MKTAEQKMSRAWLVVLGLAVVAAVFGGMFLWATFMGLLKLVGLL